LAKKKQIAVVHDFEGTTRSLTFEDVSDNDNHSSRLDRIEEVLIVSDSSRGGGEAAPIQQGSSLEGHSN
jgi:hypothetical protein